MVVTLLEPPETSDTFRPCVMLAVMLPVFWASMLIAPSARIFAFSPTFTFTVWALPMPTRASMLPPPKEARETLVLEALSE